MEVDVKGITFDVQSFGAVFSEFAMRQIGLADIIHLATARHLGCEYFASFDSDFKAMGGIIESELGLVLVDSPQALLDLVKV
jgi:predicted nucleic acid-binding protein